LNPSLLVWGTCGCAVALEKAKEESKIRNPNWIFKKTNPCNMRSIKEFPYDSKKT